MGLSIKAIYYLSEAMASVITDKVYETGIDEKTFALRLDAISWVEALLVQLYHEYNADFVDEIACRKLAFAKELSSKSDVTELKKCSAPLWDYSGYKPGSRYYIPEEELLFWARLSVRVPLNDEQATRWRAVLKEARAVPPELLIEMGL